jgi:hypothetical protein
MESMKVCSISTPNGMTHISTACTVLKHEVTCMNDFLFRISAGPVFLLHAALGDEVSPILQAYSNV